MLLTFVYKDNIITATNLKPEGGKLHIQNVVNIITPSDNNIKTKDINRRFGTYAASASIIIIIILIVEIAVILQNVFILYMVIMMYNPNMGAQYKQTFLYLQSLNKNDIVTLKYA